MLVTEAMGIYNIPLASIYELEPRELVLVMEKSYERMRFDHISQFTAIKNALGLSLAKGYKYEDLFSETKKQSKKEVSEKEKEDIISYFESW